VPSLWRDRADRVRVFLGFLVAALALGGAVWLFSYEAGSKTVGVGRPRNLRSGIVYARTATVSTEAGWEDPLAVVLAVAGVGAGVAIIASGRRSR